LLAYLIDLHYQNFFLTAPLPRIPGRVVILGGITLRISLRDAPQKPPKSQYCTDLSQVEQTLDDAKQALEQLRRIARRVEVGNQLLDDYPKTRYLEC